MTTYNYTKTPVNIDKLTQEIEESAITIVLDHITILGSNVDIIFRADLSNDEITILNGIVTNHDGQPLPEEATPVNIVNTTITTIADEPRDTETGIMKIKPRPVEASLYAQCVYFTTGDANSLDHPEDETWDIDCSTPGKTIITAKPTYSYYVDGGGFTLVGNLPTTDIKINFIISPGVGNVKIIQNKKIIANNEKFYLETPPKYAKYYSQLPAANWARIIVDHGVNEQVELELFVRFYRN